MGSPCANVGMVNCFRYLRSKSFRFALYIFWVSVAWPETKALSTHRKSIYHIAFIFASGRGWIISFPFSTIHLYNHRRRSIYSYIPNWRFFSKFRDHSLKYRLANLLARLHMARLALRFQCVSFTKAGSVSHFGDAQ